MTGNTLLHDAVETGLISQVEKILLSLEVENNHKDNFFVGCMKKFIKSPSLSKNNIINAKNCNGDTPIHIASRNGEFKIVKLLLNNGASTNVTNNRGNSPLHSTIFDYDICIHRLKIIQLLVNHGCCLNKKNYSGNTPLNIAVKYGCIHLVGKLIRSGASANVQNCRGNTPLHELILYNEGPHHLKIAKLLIEKCPHLINKCNNFGEVPLHLCHSYNHTCYEILSFLIEKGALLNIQDYLGRTPIYRAVSECGKGYTQEQKEEARQGIGFVTNEEILINECAMKFVTQLLKHGAKTDISNNFGMIPLHTAVQWNNTKVIDKLIDYGSVVDVFGNFGADDCYLNPLQLNDQVDCALTKYVIKLITANFTVNVQLQQSSFIENYKMVCIKELDKIRNTSVNTGSRLILVLSQRDNVYYLGEKNQLEVFDNFFKYKTAKKDFPLYWKILKNTFKKTKIRYNLLMKASGVLRFLFPELVIRRILYHLNNEELETLSNK